MYPLKHLIRINEFRNQMEIPFDGKHPIKDKPHHVHLMDAIKQMDMESKYNTEDFYSSSDQKKLFNKYYDEAFELYLDKNNDVDDYQMALDNLMDDGDDRYWFKSTFDMTPMDVESYLTTKGKLKFREYMKDIMDTNLLDKDFMNNMTYDEDGNGLIDIWRAIVFTGITDNDIYSVIRKFYGGIGNYWSWSETGAYPHSAPISKDNGIYVIHAKVRPEDVNWSQTIYKNAWYLRDEMEIETEPKSPILIKNVTVRINGKTVKLSDGDYMALT